MEEQDVSRGQPGGEPAEDRRGVALDRVVAAPGPGGQCQSGLVKLPLSQGIAEAGRRPEQSRGRGRWRARSLPGCGGSPASGPQTGSRRRRWDGTRCGSRCRWPRRTISAARSGWASTRRPMQKKVARSPAVSAASSRSSTRGVTSGSGPSSKVRATSPRLAAASGRRLRFGPEELALRPEADPGEHHVAGEQGPGHGRPERGGDGERRGPGGVDGGGAEQKGGRTVGPHSDHPDRHQLAAGRACRGRCGGAPAPAPRCAAPCAAAAAAGTRP